MKHDTYHAYAVHWTTPDSSIQYEITIAEPGGGIIGHTQAATADDVELMARDWLDTMGYNGESPLVISWPHP